MNAYDDMFDVRDAFERWEKAWYAWGVATEAARESDEKSIKKAERAAQRVFEALDYLRDQAANAKGGFSKRGWKQKPKKVK